MSIWDVLAAWRLVRLITTDEITSPVRDALQRRLGGWPAYLVQCRHCTGVWVAAVVWAVHGFGWWGPLALILGTAAVVSAFEEFVWRS